MSLAKYAPVFAFTEGDTHKLQGTRMSGFNNSGERPPSAHAAGHPQEDCKESLLEVIEQQIIPRLLHVQQFFPDHVASEPLPAGEQPEFLDFTQHCLSGDSLQANRVVDALLARGLAHDRVFLELITPAARHLGVLWEQDLCSFTQVTCGLAMMHQLIYRLGYASPAGPHGEGERERVMLACAPGSQHFLGLTIVADFFRRAGAEVVLEISSTESELLRAVANEWFDVIGVSVAIESQLPGLPDLIRQLRAHSGNPKARVVLGGPIFFLQELEAEALGAEAIFTDAREAVAALYHPIRPD
jgi:methylmalonyl-CoA mutase cobalamin-binding domain/chain